MIANDRLEPEYRDAYDAWQADQTPAGNATFLKAISPAVQKGVSMYGQSNKLAASRAKLIALEAAKRYDPSKARLGSHIINNLRTLGRVNQRQHSVLRAPERLLQDRARLRDYTQEIRDELGREPADSEIADKLGISQSRIAKIRRYQPGMSTGQLSHASPEGSGTAGHLPTPQEQSKHWIEMVRLDLDPTNQKILEWTLGLNGHKRMENRAIAQKLNLSPAAVSKRKAKIQELLDQEQELSPFTIGG